MPLRKDVLVLMVELQAVEHYCELLTYVKSAVTRNYSEKSINNMLSYIEKGAEDDAARQCVESFYSKTLESFQSTNNERLWLKTNIKLARLWLERKQYDQLTKKLRDLHRACEKDDGADDPSKGTYSLEIYALEIQMYSETKNNKRLKVALPWDMVRGAISDRLPGTLVALPEGSQSPVCRSASKGDGYHTRVWREDAYERR